MTFSPQVRELRDCTGFGQPDALVHALSSEADGKYWKSRDACCSAQY